MRWKVLAVLALLMSVAMVTCKKDKENDKDKDKENDGGADEEKEEMEKEELIELEGGVIPDDQVVLSDDITDHDCNNVRRFDREDTENLHPYLQRLNKVALKSKDKIYVKWNHAYGIPILGIDTFTDTAMKKACYLVRYLFADHEWLRRYSYARKMMVAGYKGGRCCPGQIGNKGMVCPCHGDYPFSGQGSPSHELFHYAIKYVLTKIPKEKLMDGLPTFFPKGTWKKTKSPMENPMLDFLWNAFFQDKENGFNHIKLRKSGIPKIHHYVIYEGMEKFINDGAGSGEMRTKLRTQLKENNPNLYNFLKLLWPCNNAYISPCKDSAYGFTLGASQRFKIGKADPNEPSKMICKEDIDEAEVETPDAISPIPDKDAPEEWITHKNKKEKEGVVDGWEPPRCEDALKRVGLKSSEKVQYGDVMQKLKLGGSDPNDHGNEYAWWMRKCCAVTAKLVKVKTTSAESTDGAAAAKQDDWNLDDVIEKYFN